MTWLVALQRHVDPRQYQLEFCTFTTVKGPYDDEILRYGGGIVRCPRAGRPLGFRRDLRDLIRNGAYDVVHSHVHYFSGLVMKLAAEVGVRIRVAHAHTAAPVAGFSPVRRTYVLAMKWAIRRYATERIAASQEAGLALFGHPSGGDGRRWQVVHCGIDLAPFRRAIDRVQLRQQLGIPPNARVLGHVGRFVPEKNHRFLLETAAFLCERMPDVYVLLVGDGPGLGQAREQASQMGFLDRVVFAGSRSDVVDLLLGAMDVFCMPSRYEGLPISALEAQAAGLPCVLADSITREVVVLPDLVRFCSLHSSPATWASLIADSFSRGRLPTELAVAAFESSDLEVRDSLRRLLSVYPV